VRCVSGWLDVPDFTGARIQHHAVARRQCSADLSRDGGAGVRPALRLVGRNRRDLNLEILRQLLGARQLCLEFVELYLDFAPPNDPGATPDFNGDAITHPSIGELEQRRRLVSFLWITFFS